MLLLWNLSFVVSIFTFIIGITKKSWVYLLTSTITFIPIALYFIGAKNAWAYVGLIPILLLILTIVFWFMQKKRVEVDQRLVRR